MQGFFYFGKILIHGMADVIDLFLRGWIDKGGLYMSIKMKITASAGGNPIKVIPAFLISVIVLLMFFGSANAEERYSLFRNLKEDVTYAVTSPSRMEKKSALITFGIIGAGAAMYSQDEKIRSYFQDRRTSSRDDISEVAANFGDGLYDLGFLAIYGGSGYFIGNEKMQETALLSLESFIVANTVGTAAKIGIGRSRPYMEDGSTRYSSFSTDSDHTAMPSGHTISVFSIASVFAEEYDNPVVDVTAYGLASMVGIQRIYGDKHWASDVFAGAVIGIVAGKSIVYLHKRKDTGSVYLLPISLPGGQGIIAVLRF